MEKLNQLINAATAEAIKCMKEGKFEVKYDCIGDYFGKDDVTIRELYEDRVSVSLFRLIDIDEDTMKFMKCAKKEILQQQLEELKAKQAKVEQQLAELN